MSNGTFLFCSNIALYEPFLCVAEIIARDYGLDGHVLAPERASVPTVWTASGKFSKECFDPASSRLPVHFLPPAGGEAERFGFEAEGLRNLLGSLRPDYVWIHAEFWEHIATQFLSHYRVRRPPRIIAYVAVNHFAGRTPLVSARWPFLSRTRLGQVLLWPRLDGVSACATTAMQCARRIGLPASVPVVVNYLPVLGPEDASSEGAKLLWHKDESFVVGFAGALTEQKGWKVLLAAIERLPGRFKALLAGDGEQRSELEAWLQRPKLKGKALYVGPLSKSKLLATYPLMDTLVLPSITTRHSVEQFGAVLAEAMASGVPVIGTTSGAIPETVGEAGLIVGERDPDALARAIIRMSEDEELRRRAIAWGLKRYQNYYSCDAYARSLAELLQIPRVGPSVSGSGELSS